MWVGKARALLLAEGRDLDGVLEPLARARELRHHGDGGEHAEAAVVAAGVDDGVEMRADHDGGRAAASCPRSGRTG